MQEDYTNRAIGNMVGLLLVHLTIIIDVPLAHDLLDALGHVRVADRAAVILFGHAGESYNLLCLPELLY